MKRWLALLAVLAAATAVRHTLAAPAAVDLVREPERRVALFFVKGERFVAVDRQIPSGAFAPAAAVQALLEGPTDSERARGIATTLPRGVSLAAVDVRGTTATARLRSPQGKPTPSDIARRPARAAQVVYTLTALPGVERVVVYVNDAKRATFDGTTLQVGPHEGRLTKPIPLTAQPARVPTGPAPVDVRGVQAKLRQLGYLATGAVTGAWDTRTRHAVLAFQSWERLTRDGVVGPQTLAALESAVRPKPRPSNSLRHVEVHRSAGVVLLVERGRVLRAVHASAGAPGYQTPAGAFTVFRKEINSWSVPYRVWLPHASYFNGGIALHGYADVPATPASHGCVRIPLAEAPAVYEFARIGTRVLVL